jgi:fatty acid desaturase
MRGHELLTDQELAEVRRRSDVMGLALVLHAWAIIFAAMALFAVWPNPLTFLLAVMLIGSRQLGLAILMHDAAHKALARTFWLNEVLGSWACGAAVAADLYAYRPYHLKHHRYTQQAEDPDLVLSAPFPVTRASLARKLLRDLSGQTGFKQRRAQLRAALGTPGAPLNARVQTFAAKLGRPLIVNGLLFAGLCALGFWWLYPALWLVPLLTWYMAVTRVRNIAEHALVPDNDDAFRNARTTLAAPLVALFLAPYWVNYHVEHHLLMWVPCYNLTKLHRLLRQKGYLLRLEIQPSYWRVLEMAAAKPALPRTPVAAT